MEMALSHISFQITSALLVSVCDREGHNSQGSKCESLCPFWAYNSQHQAVSRGTDQRPLISCNSYRCVTAVPLTQLFSYLDGCQWDKLARNWTYLITFFCHWKNWFSSFPYSSTKKVSLQEKVMCSLICRVVIFWKRYQTKSLNVWPLSHPLTYLFGFLTIHETICSY